jgi:hypothetical protein
MLPAPAPIPIPAPVAVPINPAAHIVSSPIPVLPHDTNRFRNVVDLAASHDRAIQRFANVFMSPEMKVYTWTQLNKDANAPDVYHETYLPKFDDAEIKILKGVEPQMNTGIHGGYPVFQLYDFIWTVRQVLQRIDMRRSQLENLQAAVSDALLADLKSDIFHPSFVPWAIIDNAPGAKLTSDMTAKNYRIGDDYEPNGSVKSEFDKAFDRALLLRSEIVGSLQALRQGLFKCNLVHQGEPVHRWINGRDGAPLNFNSAHHELLEPQSTTPQNYPNNWVARTLNLWKVPHVADEYGYYSDTKPIVEYFSPLRQGGAIAEWIVKVDGAPNNQYYPVAPTDLSNLTADDTNALFHLMLDTGIVWTPIPNNKMFYHTTHIPLKKITDIVEVKYKNNNPLYIMGKLAEAFARSELFDYVYGQYTNLQKLIAEKLKTINYGREFLDSRQVFTTGGTTTAPEVGSCPVSSIPMYVNADGGTSNEDNATFVKDGVRYYNQGFSAAGKICVPVRRVVTANIRAAETVDQSLMALIKNL